MKQTFKTLAGAAALVMWIVGGASAATVYSGVVGSGNDPFPASLDGSPSLAKCDMEAEGNIDVDCNIWEEGASAGIYTSGTAFGDDLDKFPNSAFNVVYTSETAFDWFFEPSEVIGELLYPTKIAVKTGNPNSYYVYNVTLGDVFGSVDLESDDIFTGAISHVSFYDSGLEVIPLPAAGWLLLAGVGGLAALRRRKKT